MDDNFSGREHPQYDINSPRQQLPPLPESAPFVPAEETPIAASHAGNGANGNGAKLKEPISLFWQQPISSEEEVNWFVPPLPRREDQHGPVEGLLDQLTKMMPSMPMRAWLTKWNYQTRSAAAAAEQADVERESERRFSEQVARGEVDARKLDDVIVGLESREQQIEKDLTDAQKEFAEAAANAGLACEPKPRGPAAQPQHRTLVAGRAGSAPANTVAPDPIADLHYAPSGINPQCVEDALQNELPDLDAVAGQFGVSPIPRQTLWATILSFFMQFLAPLVCGFMLALCLGTLVGILDLDDFSRRDSFPKFALAAALGFVIVYLMGDLFSNAVHSLTRALEIQNEDRGNKRDNNLDGFGEEYSRSRTTVTAVPAAISAPKLRYGMRIALGFVGAALFLGFAELIAEGYGIRELHHQQIARRERFRSPTAFGESELPMPLYLIVGTLISGPYLFYKASKAWGESDILLREAWLLHQQRNWLDERRARPETGRAFQLACRVEQLENSLYDLKIQSKRLQEQRANLHNMEPDRAMQQRRKEARAAAVGEALRLQTMVEEIVDTVEPFGGGGHAAVRPAQSSQEPPRTAWSVRTPTART